MYKEEINQQRSEGSFKQQAQEQSQLKAETEQTLQQMQQQYPNNPQPPQMQQASSELEQAVDAQYDAETQLKASHGDAAKRSQDGAVEHLENALKELSGDNQQNQGQQQEQQGQTQQPQEPNQPSEEQQQQKQEEREAAFAPDTTAQEILDKEHKKKTKTTPSEHRLPESGEGLVI